jgi:hypothetical protein
MGLPASASTLPIRYSVTTFAPYGERSGVDRTPWVGLDVANPAVTTPSPLFVDAANETVPYSTSSTGGGDQLTTTTKPGAQRAAAGQSVSALVLHLGGRTGRRAEVVSLPKP